ncbi:MAG: DUF4405 domain-containing protein [Verrucomicrobiia bacterium]
MKPRLMRTVNWLLYAGFCALTGTGLLLSFRMPPGSRGGRGLEFLGWGRHDWGDVHLWIALAVIALTVAHLVLNWAWVKKVGSDGRHWGLLGRGSIGLALVVVFLVLPVTRQQGLETERMGHNAIGYTAGH